jgi:tRNA modification GTPase
LPVKLESLGRAGSPLSADGAHGVMRPAATNVMNISCVSGQGIEALKDAIKALVWAGEIKAEMLQVAINARHQDALKRARAAARQAADALRADATLELVAMDLRIAANAVGEIVGRTVTEDLLHATFSTFCIGK